MKLKRPSAYWAELDEKRRSEYRIVAAVLLGIFTLFTAIAVGSYFFTWKQDASLLSEPSLMESDVAVSNAGSKLGFRWGRFLVTRSFGLAALGLVAFLVAWTLSRAVPKLRIHLGKWFVYSFTGTFIGSWLLALVSRLAGWETLFGGGLGGRAGGALVDGCINLVGFVVTAIALLALAGLWLYFLTGGFKPADEEIPGQAGNEEPEPEPVPEPVVRQVHQPVPFSAPEPVEGPKPEPKPEPVRVAQVSTPSPAEVATEPAAEPEGTFTVETDDTLDQKVREPLPRIDNRADLPKYKFPTLDILGDYLSARHEPSQDELNRNNNKIRATLASYKIQVKDVTAIVGPTVTLYKVYPAPGVKIASIKMLQDDIAISLNAKGVRIVTLSDSVGIEVANDTPSIVPLKQLLNDDSYRNSKAELPVAIGYTISQKVKVFDLADAPHLLVAGATKQGKSVGLNVIVSSLLYAKHPSELKFVFIDPKMVEFSAYAKLLNHYLAVLPNAADEQDERDQAIVKNAKSASSILQSLCIEMDERYALLNKAGVNNIKLYNDKYRDRHLLPTEGHRFLPYMVVVIDEYADLTMSTGASGDVKTIARSISSSIIRLAQKGRAAGIHVVIATQRPSADVITGLMKANIPSRIAFAVSSGLESRIILDQQGAEKLVGNGDMLYAPIGTRKPTRIQGAFVSDEEREEVIQFIKNQASAEYDDEIMATIERAAEEKNAKQNEGNGGGKESNNSDYDELLPQAVDVIFDTKQASVSMLQRRLKLGYARAARIVDQMEELGIVGPFEGSKPRQVLITKEQWQEMQMIHGTAPTEIMETHMEFDEEDTFDDPMDEV